MPDQEAMTDERSSTPRTDAVAEIAFNACNTPGEVVFADFARELEREIEGLRDLVRDVCGEHIDFLVAEYSDTTDPLDPQAAQLGFKAKKLQEALAGEAGNTSNEK